MFGRNWILAGIEFLEFKPSEIAAAVAMYVSREMEAMHIDKPLSCLIGVDTVGIFNGPPNKILISLSHTLSRFNSKYWFSRVSPYLIFAIGNSLILVIYTNNH